MVQGEREVVLRERGRGESGGETERWVREHEAWERDRERERDELERLVRLCFEQGLAPRFEVTLSFI